MRRNIYAVLCSAALMLFFTCAIMSGEECPETGTSFDPLIREAYECREDFNEADISVDHGVDEFKGIYCTVMGITEESKDTVMNMADSSFLNLVADDSVKAQVKEKLTEDSEMMLDTLAAETDKGLSDLRVINDSALEISQEIPKAIAKLPSELKGLNKTKIPAVKAALEKAKGWVDDVRIACPEVIDTAEMVLAIVGYLRAENVGE